MGRKGAVALAVGLVLAGWPETPAALDGLQVGMKAPAFTLEALDGARVALGDFPRARVLVVLFWAAWSEHSGEELRRLEALYRQYRTRGLVVLAVNVENQQIGPADLAGIRRMAADLGLTFPVLIDRGLQTFRAYGVVAVPSTVVLERDGTITAEMAAYPLATREDLFELITATIEDRPVAKRAVREGYQPVPRAVRYYNLARAMQSRGMSDSVDGNLQKAIESDSKFALPLILRGQILKERALTEDAIEYGGATVTTATHRAERERYLREAADLFARALALDPKSAAALTELADLKLVRGEADAARSLLQRALAIEPSHTPGHALLGTVLLRAGDVAGASAAFAQATKLNPLDHRVHLTMAQAYEGRGMTAEALPAYRRALEILWSARRDLLPLSHGRP